MIAAVGQHLELGRDNELLWHLPDDFQWFIKHTKHKPVVMGRNTMDSLGKPLKNRKNMVLSSKKSGILEGFEHYSTLEEIIDLERGLGTKELMIIGGGALYAYAISLCDRIYLTKVNASFDGADTFFPAMFEEEWTLHYHEKHGIDDKHEYEFEFLILDRK